MMRPVYNIEADGDDITGKIGGRLIRLTIHDKSGTEADTAEIELDDIGYEIALPPVGAKLKIALGFAPAPTAMGLYTVDRVSGSGPRAVLKIKAKAADMTSAMRAPRNRSWTKPTLGQIVSKIAGDHGLEPMIDKDLSKAKFSYVAQTSESDLHLLTRLATDLDAVVKPAGGKLVVAKRGTGIGANGEKIPPVSLDASFLTDWTYSIDGRRRYKKATATWWDAAAGKLEKLTYGDDKPAIEIRHRYGSKDEAQRAAKAMVEGSGRATGKITLNCTAFVPAATAGGEIILTGIKPELCGSWIIETVTHRLGGPLHTSIVAQRDNEKEKS